MTASERMTRRSVLATLGASAVALAGCQSRTGPDDTVTPVSTGGLDSPTDRSVDDITLGDISVRKAVTYSSTMGSGGVLTPPDRQFVIATVQSTRELSAESFAFVTPSQRLRPGLPRTAGAKTAAVAGHDGGLVGESVSTTPASVLVFEVPSSLDVTAARIEYTEGGLTWELPAPAIERLGAPSPEFALRGLSVPETIQQGEPLDVALSVENTTDTDGRFLAALYWPTELIADDDESTIVEQTIRGGSEATSRVGIGTDYTTNEPGPIQLRVRGHVIATETVSVTETTTPS